MTLPNFLIVGAQKSGTTSLHDILSQHPEANLSKVKEINFFTNDAKYSKGLDYYSGFFEAPGPGQLITGESSPGYMCHPGVDARIRKDLGKIKIVMILRDPIKRAFSQYWDNRRHLSESMSESEIVDKFLNADYIPGMRGYFSRGVYLKYIKRYQQLFGDNSIYVLLLERLIERPTDELRSLYRFLGVSENRGLQQLPPASNSSMIWKNSFYRFVFNNPKYTAYLPMRSRKFLFFGKQEQYKYQLPKGELMENLLGFYRPWNTELSTHLNLDLSKWLV